MLRLTLIAGGLLLTGCDRRERQVSECIQLYGEVPGGVRGCLESRYGWDATTANRAELRHLKILQDGGAR